MFRLTILASLAMTSVICYKPPDNFCDVINPLCKGNKHLHCGGKLDKHEYLGRTPEKMNLGEDMKQLILNLHNEMRNAFACGDRQITNVAGDVFPKAARLPKMIWDEELEWGADRNGETCAYNHDCMVTPTYKQAGQNLAAKRTEIEWTPEQIITPLVKNWWMEYINCPISAIKKYEGKSTVKSINDFTEEEDTKSKILHTKGKKMFAVITHFTAFIKEASKIGCVLYKCGEFEGRKFTYYLVCNYEKSNIVGEGTYKISETGGSECKVKSKKYCCLCLDDSDKETPESCHKTDVLLPDFKKTESTSKAGTQPATGQSSPTKSSDQIATESSVPKNNKSPCKITLAKSSTLSKDFIFRFLTFTYFIVLI